jgi:eukaryotic-like serine/threonine-protein kinase
LVLVPGEERHALLIAVSESFAAALVGVVLDDRYRLDALLGEGGMGAVYQAHHLAMDRRVAIKLLKPHLTSDDAALQRFLREARATMKVDSEHAVKVLDFGITLQRDYYMVLEYLDGRTVQRELDVDGPFAPSRVVHIARQVLHALGAAHSSGLVHRDIKPDNILLSRVGDDPDHVKVLDFGVAKLMEGTARSAQSALAITQAGMVFGTPSFMSPEQACGQTLDGRSDLYSLAATMFAMLTGCGMYKASSAIEWLVHHARTPPPHLVDGSPTLAPYTALDELLQRCLAKRRDDRPRDAAHMLALLDEIAPALRDPHASVASVSGRPGPPASDGLSMDSRPGSSASMYVPALDPEATLLPSAGPVIAGSSDAMPATTTVVSQLTRGRRVRWIGVATAVVAGTVAIGISARGLGKRHPTRSPSVEAAGVARDPGVAPDTSVPAPPTLLEPTLGDGSAASSAANAARLSGESPPGAPRTRGPRLAPAAQAHVAEAEAARRAGNRLRQLAEADAALQAEPRNMRARFLFADALIASGDLDRGCKHLRELGKNPTARERARQAGCPSDRAGPGKAGPYD